MGLSPWEKRSYFERLNLEYMERIRCRNINKRGNTRRDGNKNGDRNVNNKKGSVMDMKDLVMDKRDGFTDN